MTLDPLSTFQELKQRLLSSPDEKDLQRLNTAVERIAQNYLHTSLDPARSKPVYSWIQSEAIEPIQRVIEDLKELHERLPDQGFLAQSIRLDQFLTKSQEHILVQLEDGCSIVMDKNDSSLFETLPIGLTEINVRENLGIDPQVMLRVLIALREQHAPSSECLTEEQKSRLNPELEPLSLFLTGEKGIAYLIEKFGESRASELVLALNVAADYLCMDSDTVLSKISMDINHSYADIKDNDFLIHLLAAAQERCLGLLARNLQIELLSHRYRHSALESHALLKTIGTPRFDKERLPTMSPQEKVIHLLRAVKDRDHEVFSALLDNFHTQKMTLSDRDFAHCMALGKGGVRRAVVLAAALDKPAVIDRVLSSPQANQIFVHDKHYGWSRALKEAARNGSMASIERMFQIPKVKEFLESSSASSRSLIVDILMAAARGGHLTAMDKAIERLGGSPLKEGQITDILEAAARGGHLGAMDKAIGLLGGRPLDKVQITRILQGAAGGGHLTAMDQAIGLLHGRPLMEEYITRILGEAAGGGHLEAMDKAIGLLHGRPLEDWQIADILERAALGGHLGAMDKAIGLLHGRPLEEGQIARILSAAAVGGHLTAMDKAIGLLGGRPFEKEQIAEILEKAAGGGHLGAMDKAIGLLGGRPLEERQITGILAAAARSGHLGAMDKAIGLLGGRPLDKVQITHILQGAAGGGHLTAMDQAIGLLHGGPLMEKYITRILGEAAGGGHLTAMDKAIGLLHGESQGEAWISHILLRATPGGYVEAIEKIAEFLPAGESLRDCLQTFENGHPNEFPIIQELLDNPEV